MTFFQSLAHSLDLSWFWSGLTAGMAGFFTWLFSRRKYKAESAAAELRNVQQAITIWRETADRFEERVTDLETRLAEKSKIEEHLRNEVINLRGEVKQLKDALETYKDENQALRDAMNNLNSRPQ